MVTCLNLSYPFLLEASRFLGRGSKPTETVPVQRSFYGKRSMVVEAGGRSRIESPKLRNRRMRKKFNGTPARPRISVFCSDKQLYAMLVDDESKKCLFYGSTLQKSIRGEPPCDTIEASRRVGEELVKASIALNINEISSYDRNRSGYGERLRAFEIPIAEHGFIPP